MNWNKFKKINWLSFLHNTFIGKTASRKLVLFYIYAIIIGIILLSLPISFNNPGYVVLADGTLSKFNFIDSFFVTISAFTDTGLIHFVISSTYNFFGQLVIMLLIQIGGIGLFVIYWMFWNLIFNNIFYKKYKGIPIYEKNKMGFSNTILISSERGNSKLGLSSSTIKTALIFIFSTEIIFSIIYSLWFGLSPTKELVDINSLYSNTGLDSNVWYVSGQNFVNMYHNPSKAIWTGIFNSVSVLNNAGFDIFGNCSASAYRNGSDTFIQYMMMMQIIIGGIGFPVFYDLIQWFKFKHKKQKFYFSLFTKVSVITYFIILIIGLIFMLSFEYCLNDSLIHTVNNNQYLKDRYFSNESKGWNQFTYILFTTISTRSAGLYTIPMNEISDGSKWILILLMFIGCAPSSTGGGIRTTVVAILFMSMISIIKKYKNIVIFKRSISQSTVNNSFVITFLSAGLILFFSIITYPIIINKTDITFTNILFEFSSAYGTVGLSSGVTSFLINNDLNAWVLAILLSIIMIIGQLGIPTTLLSLNNNNNKIVKYSTEEIKI